MNLDNLISKYLDGELTPQQDLSLRDLLAGDKESKEIFDTAVIINSSCREDARTIVPPKDFIEETESKILMRILAEQPIVEEKVYTGYGIKKNFQFALSFACILILGFFSISDFSLQNYKPMLVSMLYEERAKVEKQYISESHSDKLSPIVKAKNVRTGVYVHKSSIASLNPVIDKQSTNSLISANIVPEKSNESSIGSNIESSVDNITVKDSETAQLLSDSKISSGSFASNQASVQGSIIQNNNSMLKSVYSPQPIPVSVGGAFSSKGYSSNSLLQMATLDYYSAKTDIQLSSFFGTDVARVGLDVNKGDVVSHFSQSLGYPIDKENMFGVEFGYTKFNYNDKMLVSMPVSTKANGLASIEVRNPGEEEGINLLVPVEMKREKQIVWGSAYFERNLIDYGKFTLNGRLGVGASSDGMLSFGRLFAKYQIFPGFSLTIGADARMFKARMVSSSEITDTWRGTSSLIYGFQVKL